MVPRKSLSAPSTDSHPDPKALAHGLREAESGKKKDKLLAMVSEGLPTLPACLFELNEILCRTPVDFKRATQVIRADPSLTAEVMRSTPHRHTRESHGLFSLESAVHQLGLEHLKRLVMTSSMLEFRGRQISLPTIQLFWQHSLLTALLSERIAWFIGYRDPELAYVGGLLHDIGTLPLLILAATEQFEGAAPDPPSMSEDSDEQKKTFGLTHSDAGRWLGTAWRFPAAILEVLEYHHQPSLAKHDPQFVGIVTAADMYATRRGVGLSAAPPEFRVTGIAEAEKILRFSLPSLTPTASHQLAESLEVQFLHLIPQIEMGTSGLFNSAAVSQIPKFEEIP